MEGFYFHGWETIVLSERLEETGFAEGHLWPKGNMVWIENNLNPKDIYDRLYEQEMIGPVERYGKVRVEGRFDYGERYGHAGGFDAQIVPSKVELLPWSPSPKPQATPTPLVTREWNLEDIQVDGSTVTVLLHVFAAIDVRVTLDGRSADLLNAKVPILGFIFQNVALGKHTIEVRDVVGFNEIADVVVPTPTPEFPEWLAGLIQRLESEPVANPPASITRYEHDGQTVYFIPQRCCDIFSELYDSNGNIIGHPDGGITGQGDGRVPDFFEMRRDESVIWQDQRAYNPRLVQVASPIERVEVVVIDGFPQQYSVVVVSGLSNACVSLGGYRLQRDADTVQIEMLNLKPADPDMMCAQVYRTVETRIPLGVEFESGKAYSVVVNDVTETFVAQ